MKRFVQNSAIITASMLAFTISGEVFVKIHDIYALHVKRLEYQDAVQSHKIPFQKSDNPELLFEFIPHWEGEYDDAYFRINSHGFRDYDYSYKKEPNSFRIVVLGDSITAGDGVNDIAALYPNILEQQLNSLSSRTFEVLNLGVPGYNTIQQFYTLRDKGLKYAPDLVIIGYFINDPEPAGIEFSPPMSLKKYFATDFLRFKFLDYIGYSGYRLSKLIQLRRNLSPTWLYTLEINQEHTAEWLACEAHLKKIADLAKRYEIKVLMAQIPLMLDFDNYPFIQAHELAAKVARENGMIVLDLLPYFKGYDAPDFWSGPKKKNGHPNEAGHKIIANAILRILLERQLVPLNKT